jgi:hypothetical protein
VRHLCGRNETLQSSANRRHRINSHPYQFAHTRNTQKLPFPTCFCVMPLWAGNRLSPIFAKAHKKGAPKGAFGGQHEPTGSRSDQLSLPRLRD